MKKLFLFLALALSCFAKSSAQNESFYGVFNHVGAGLNVGTEGIGINVAAPLTKYLEVSAGIDFMPGFKINGDVDVNDLNTSGYTIPIDAVNVEGKFSRTTMNVKFSCYPFGDRNNLFVAAGFSFGGKKIAKLKGHSDDILNFMQRPDVPDYVKDEVYAQIDKYQVKFNENGDVLGDVRVSGFRPYLGLGYGRLVPKKRVGFRVELGAQFHGKMKIYQSDKLVDTNDIDDVDDDISKIVDKLPVYPVLKFTISGRIL